MNYDEVRRSLLELSLWVLCLEIGRGRTVFVMHVAGGLRDARQLLSTTTTTSPLVLKTTSAKI